MGISATSIVNEFAVRPDLLRRAIAQHKTWIEQQLGVSLSEAVILETDLDLTQIGIELILAIPPVQRPISSTATRLRPSVLSAATPPEFLPLCEIIKVTQPMNLFALLRAKSTIRKSTISWADCPIALRIRRQEFEFAIVAINVSYHSGPGSDLESTSRLIVAQRENASEVMRLLEELDRRDNKPRLHIVGSSNNRIVGCQWDDLVLDHKIRSLLKDDFESFFEREAWFRENKLPFRRGYLLHGPPGNGKSTAVRAMMTSRGLTAYTTRLFDSQVDDSDLDRLFELAVKNRPSMVLLEDLDRAFPKTGVTKSRVSLQQLLNNLDGVGTGEGVIVVATANEPTILDPAILHRPGRFDRVVHFPNPCAELRQQYLQQLNPGLFPRHLKLSVEQSDGLSFAQLREVHIIAGQRAFERKGEIGEADLLLAIHALRQSNLTASRSGNAAGFHAREEVSA
jgi:DNA polymerase III delta prime subunit